MDENQPFAFGEDVQEENVVITDTPSIFDEGNNYDGPEDNGEPDQVIDDEDQPQDEGGQDAYLSKLLAYKQIDRNHIEITDEDGTVSEVSFDDLSDEDKFALLTQDVPVQESYITDNDLAVLNYFRANRINSLQEFADGVAKQAVDEYIASQASQPASDIDFFTDDEVIAYDFIQKFGEEMTDEEIDSEIERLKGDEEAYNKRVNLLRTYYKNEEEAQRMLYEEEQTNQKNENTQAFINAYQSAASDLDTIQGIDLEYADKQAVLDFALNKDSFGRTELAKALDDPEKVLKMCWFLQYGEMAAEATRNYFAQQLTKARAQAAKPTPKPQSRAVSRPSTAAAPRTKSTSAFKF